MSLKPNLRPLPEADRRERLAKFLALLNCDPNLVHLRSLLRTGPERQLALFAALERDVVKGSPAASPPAPDDQADLLLCDVLDCLDRDPEIKRHGAYYDVYRHLANLQSFGLWRKKEPISRPTALELFATMFANLTAEPATTLPALAPNTSPDPQVSSPNGEVFAASSNDQPDSLGAEISSQPATSLAVTTPQGETSDASNPLQPPGILRHEAQTSGEVFGSDASELPLIPARPIRRGQPPKLDDLAKGRLLGLISHGLSFRQAAAQLGIHHQTILNTMKRDEEFAQQVAEARLDAISQPLLTVIAASRKNWRAAAWLAKFLNDRRASGYEATPEERELTRK
jgi:hypothetical protein